MTTLSPEHSRRTFLLWAVLLWATLLLIGSLMPLRFKQALRITRNHHIIHPLLHVVAFGLLSAFVYGSATSRRKRVYGLVAVLAFGFALEWLEQRYHLQKIETADIRFDAYGAIAGYLLFIAFQQFRMKICPP